MDKVLHVTYTPDARRQALGEEVVEGLLVAWVNGCDGANVLAPTASDPWRVVRVWRSNGTIKVRDAD